MKEIVEFARSRFGKYERELWDKLSTEGRFELLKKWFKKDFRSLVYLLGYEKLGKFHDKEVDALSQVRTLDDTSTRRLWLWSRGFFKTTLITECHSVYLILNNPNIRMLLCSNTISVAEDMLRNVKNHFIGNKALRHFFKEFCPIPNTVGKIEFGTSQDFTCPCRTLMRKEPTMMVAGVGTNLTGLHFDYMKLDDLVTKDSVTNDTQIQASKDYYASLRHLFDKAAVPREDVVGTIYHFNDLYYSVLQKSKLFKESFIPARVGGVATFPERLPDDKLDELINDPSVGPWQFSTQYMLSPINPADAKFKSEWLKEYDSIPEGCSQYICVDPASTTKKKSDFSVLERWGVDSTGKHYLLEGIRDKFTAFQRIDALFGMVGHAKNLKFVKYEVIGGRHGDLEEIERRQMDAVQKRTAGYRRFTIKETKGSVASKIDRIEQRLVGPYHAGMILLPQNSYFISKFDGKVYDFVQLLKLEYLQFPFTEHDDILDCQAQMFEESIIKGQKIETPVSTQGMTANDWEKMYRELDMVKSKFPDMSSEEASHELAGNKLRQRLISLKYKRG